MDWCKQPEAVTNRNHEADDRKLEVLARICKRLTTYVCLYCFSLSRPQTNMIIGCQRTRNLKNNRTVMYISREIHKILTEHNISARFNSSWRSVPCPELLPTGPCDGPWVNVWSHLRPLGIQGNWRVTLVASLSLFNDHSITPMLPGTYGTVFTTTDHYPLQCRNVFNTPREELTRTSSAAACRARDKNV